MGWNMKQWGRTPHEERWLYLLRWGIGVNALVGVALFIARHGFDVDANAERLLRNGLVAVANVFVFGYITQLILRHDRWQYLRQNSIKYALTFITLLDFLARWDSQSFIFQLFILVNIFRWIIKIVQFFAQFNASPPRFITASFLLVILTGAALLMLPKSTTHGIAFIDALFTITSAVCVTGLIVVDTATAFTTTGQLVVLAFIQIGGLGIMTITAFFSLYIGQKMSAKEKLLLGDMLATERLAALGSVLKSVLLATFIIETLGACLLYWAFLTQTVHPMSPEEAAYHALFHAISAFCNAGFSTFTENLLGYAEHMGINLTICGLIILGGLGFGVIHNLYSQIGAKARRERITIHTKLTMRVTIALLLAGTAGVFMLEYFNLFADFEGAHSLKTKIMAAFFQSVTCRTAGFNTIDIAKLQDVTLLISILLMFIGAGSGSTGGGIKVSTFGMLLATVWAFARGRSRVELFRRTIPNLVLYQAIVVFSLYLGITVVIWFLLMLTPIGERPINLLFETVSALGTVGLSTGVTPKLTTVGKLLIIATMFLGRVGPFTLALAIGQRQHVESYRYPEERVVIG